VTQRGVAWLPRCRVILSTGPFATWTGPVASTVDMCSVDRALFSGSPAWPRATGYRGRQMEVPHLLPIVWILPT
jgi:hypothetical protein